MSSAEGNRLEVDAVHAGYPAPDHRPRYKVSGQYHGEAVHLGSLSVGSADVEILAFDVFFNEHVHLPAGKGREARLGDGELKLLKLSLSLASFGNEFLMVPLIRQRSGFCSLLQRIDERTDPIELRPA